jgi:hypothetical protein
MSLSRYIDLYPVFYYGVSVSQYMNSINATNNQGRARSQYLCCSRGTAAAEKARLSSSHGRKGAQEKQRQNMYQRLCCTAVIRHSRPFYRKRADGIFYLAD